MIDLESVHEVYPYSERDKMQIELWNLVQNHPQDGKWKQGYAGVGLMLSAASHERASDALLLIVDDAIKARDIGVPVDVIGVALKQVVNWRKILLEAPPEKIPVTGDISIIDLEKELEKVLPPDYVKQLFE